MHVGNCTVRPLAQGEEYSLSEYFDTECAVCDGTGKITVQVSAGHEYNGLVIEPQFKQEDCPHC